MLRKVVIQLLYIIIRFLNLTYKFNYLQVENKEKAQEHHPKGGYIYAIWHQNIIAGVLSEPYSPHLALISSSKDGELAAGVYEKLGHIAVRGSSTRGGKTAMKEMINLMNQGIPAAITVDGPLGPAKEVKAGIIEIARQSGRPIIPYSVYPEKFWAFEKSWDHFRLPKPFSRIFVKYGNPIVISPDITKDEFTKIQQQIKFEISDLEEKTIQTIS